MLRNANPWMLVMGLVAALVLFAGIAMAAGNTDPTAFDYSPGQAVLGPPFIVVGGVIFAGMLAAGAINWQLRRR